MTNLLAIGLMTELDYLPVSEHEEIIRREAWFLEAIRAGATDEEISEAAEFSAEFTAQ